MYMYDNIYTIGWVCVYTMYIYNNVYTIGWVCLCIQCTSMTTYTRYTEFVCIQCTFMTTYTRLAEFVWRYHMYKYTLMIRYIRNWRILRNSLALAKRYNKKDKLKRLNDVVYPTIRISQPATRWSCFVKKEHWVNTFVVICNRYS